MEVLVTAGKVDAAVVDELEKMQRGGGYLKILSAPVNIHSKFMLITGTWNGKPRKIVLNGTHNYTSNALEDNNELLLLLKDSPLFKDYEDYFERIKQL